MFHSLKEFPDNENQDFAWEKENQDPPANQTENTS